MEVNKRINYPIKLALVGMLDKGDISLDDDLSRYCISWCSICVASVGVALFVSSWNEHPIPGISKGTLYCSTMYSLT